MFSTDFTVMLVGRFLQGFGLAGPRIVAVAVIRDLYEGRAMARVMSFVMAVFIVAPAVAPAVGQGVIYLSHWRALFGALLALGIIVAVWFSLRLPETLEPERRPPFSLRRIGRSIAEICRTRSTMGYILATGLVFGPFLGYLNSSQQVYVGIFDVGSMFPAYFAVLAAAMGVASLVNAKLVMRIGMRQLSIWSAVASACLAIAFLLILLLHSKEPPLWVFMSFFFVVFFCNGLLFGNLNSLAMEPLGHIAGIGSAVIGFLSTAISVTLGLIIGKAFDGTIVPLVTGYAAFGVLLVLTMVWTEPGRGGSKT